MFACYAVNEILTLATTMLNTFEFPGCGMASNMSISVDVRAVFALLPRFALRECVVMIAVDCRKFCFD